MDHKISLLCNEILSIAPQYEAHKVELRRLNALFHDILEHSKGRKELKEVYEDTQIRYQDFIGMHYIDMDYLHRCLEESWREVVDVWERKLRREAVRIRYSAVLKSTDDLSPSLKNGLI